MIDDEEIDLDEMSEDELKTMIEDVIGDMVETGELEAGGDPVEMSDEETEEVEDDRRSLLMLKLVKRKLMEKRK